jgi:chemotaxis protein histidine kinase CheA
MFRNSVDHGIEPAEMRVKCQKPEAGQIHVNCSVVQDRLLIIYQDDGIGLDLEAIRNKARDRGLLSGSRSYSRLEIASLIFISGFSTKSAVSEISGRGVGLDAVRTYVESLGGTITICLENESEGSYTPFAFQISLPAEYLCLGPTALRTAS